MSLPSYSLLEGYVNRAARAPPLAAIRNSQGVRKAWIKSGIPAPEQGGVRMGADVPRIASTSPTFLEDRYRWITAAGMILCVAIPVAIWFAPVDVDPPSRHGLANSMHATAYGSAGGWSSSNSFCAVSGRVLLAFDRQHETNRRLRVSSHACYTSLS